jgi:hypothetical protein
VLFIGGLITGDDFSPPHLDGTHPPALGYREYSIFFPKPRPRRETIHLLNNLLSRIPFFFEPNFDAVVRPLTVVSRLNDEEPGKKSEVGPLRRPVVYGDFLWSKVKNNFDLTGKGKYD